MSAIASFLRIRIPDLQDLREAAVPTKRLFRSPHDGFWDFLRTRARPVLEFDGSGYIFATLLPFLEEKRGINLMNSRHDELAAFVSETRVATCFFLTMEHQACHLEALDPGRFDGAELRVFYNAFTETNEPAAGEAMLDGIKALITALEALEQDCVVLLYIG